MESEKNTFEKIKNIFVSPIASFVNHCCIIEALSFGKKKWLGLNIMWNCNIMNIPLRSLPGSTQRYHFVIARLTDELVSLWRTFSSLNLCWFCKKKPILESYNQRFELIVNWLKKVSKEKEWKNDWRKTKSVSRKERTNERKRPENASTFLDHYMKIIWMWNLLKLEELLSCDVRAFTKKNARSSVLHRQWPVGALFGVTVILPAIVRSSSSE